MSRIVGISGLAGCGKSTAANALAAERGFVIVNLADPMKRACAEWFGWDEPRLWGPSAERNAPDPAFGGLSARRALQFIGTQVGRELYQDLWVEIALRTARTLLADPAFVYTPETGLVDTGVILEADTHPTRGVVIPDVRFENEIRAIRAAGGIVLRIVREGSGLTGDAGTHASETEQATIPQSAFDGLIFNNGTVDDLETAVLAMVDVARST